MNKSEKIYSFYSLPKNTTFLGVASIFVAISLLFSLSAILVFKFSLTWQSTHPYVKLAITLIPLFASAIYFNWVYKKASDNYEKYLETVPISLLKNLMDNRVEIPKTYRERVNYVKEGGLGKETLTLIQTYLKTKQEIDDE